jgi:hypothetical protein
MTIFQRLACAAFAHLLALAFTHPLYAQSPPPSTPPSTPPPFIARLRTTLDATNTAWGAGLATADKLRIFDSVWAQVSRDFACFRANVNINTSANASTSVLSAGMSTNFIAFIAATQPVVNWDSLRTVLRSRIQAGVSRGRFAGIMNHLMLALRESHSIATDNVVNARTALTQGTPLMVVGGWGENGHFGAGLTPLADSSLLVYSTVSNHPLGLERGDLVLGYELSDADGAQRLAWKDLVPMLLAEQFPLAGWWWGSAPSAFAHSFLMSAGLNWHLFSAADKLVIAKFRTRDTIVRSLAPLVAARSAGLLSHVATEQLPVAGVQFPLGTSNSAVSWGIVSGTGAANRIGYIYVWAWAGNAAELFDEAVSALADRTDGLIVDVRTNYGGELLLSNDGLRRLFPQPTPTVGFAPRTSAQDRLSLAPARSSSTPSTFVIPADPLNPRGYTKPIAVLLGPGAVSAGDHVAYRLSLHPRARVFGRPSAGCFNTPVRMPLAGISPDWSFRYAYDDAFRVGDTTRFLTRTSIRIDEPVWLTRNGVAAGVDDVVEAALRWMIPSRALQTSVRTGVQTNAQTSAQTQLRAAPNPASQHIVFSFTSSTNNFSTDNSSMNTLAKPAMVRLTLSDVLGRVVYEDAQTLAETRIASGAAANEQRCTLDVRSLNVPDGVYNAVLHTAQGKASVQVVVRR